MRSMTGFGQAAVQRGPVSIAVEIRAVNQRFLDVRLNMPREYLPWEAELRALVQGAVARGKVDVAVSRSGAGGDRVEVEPNLALALAYVRAWRKIRRAVHLPGDGDLTFLQGRPELFRVTERRSAPAVEMVSVRTAVKRGLENLNRERQREGRALGKDMMARTRHLMQIERQLAARVTELVPQFAARLRDRAETLLAGATVSEERLLQEVAVLAERSDVTEELVRLRSHLQGLRELFRSGDAIGKKVDFLLQEVHREVNTVAAKSADLTVTNLTLEARGEIEKLREQVQNVE